MERAEGGGNCGGPLSDGEMAKDLVENVVLDIRTRNFRVTLDTRGSREGAMTLKDTCHSCQRFQRVDVLRVVLGLQSDNKKSLEHGHVYPE